MNLTQIQTALNTLFHEKGERIVFWHDGDREFEDSLPSIELDGIKTVRMDTVAPLELKIDIESGDPETRWLLYAPFHEPDPEDDWLLDIRMYSESFQADKASIIFNELNLAHQSVRPYLKTRTLFFNNKERLNRLRKWVKPEDREDDIDLKMLAVVVRADQPDFFSVLLKLFESYCNGGELNLTEPSVRWAEIEKLELAPSFWNFAARMFGYVNEDNPKISDFLIRLFVTDFANQLKSDPPAALAHFVIQNQDYAMNATVFPAQWRSNLHHFRNYNRISNHIGEKLKIKDLLIACPVEDLADVMTFEAAERRIISGLRDRIIKGADTGDSVRNLIKIRLDGYWATAVMDTSGKANQYRTVYAALEAALQLFDLRTEYGDGFSFQSAEAMFKAYSGALFRFDQLYRRFSELSDDVETAGWDILKKLRRTVEDCYSGWFMDRIALTWGEFLDGGGFLTQWKLPGIVNQFDFFNRYVQPSLNEPGRSRIFVVISDGFRYEAAEELMRTINGKQRLKAEIQPMLSVLPSDTATGMAALLPHKKLTFNEKSGVVLVDGKPSGSLEQRSKILSGHHGIAIKDDALTAMSRDQGREFVKPHRIIYVYNDRVDSTGDKAGSEDQTFGAVRKAIDDLAALVNYIINNLNGTRVVITADHGFVYQDTPPAPMDKSVFDKTGKDVVKDHKRFVLGRGLEKSKNTFWADTAVTAKCSGMNVLTPKGTNRFNFMGGAKYYHGGPLLQEIVVPVLTVSELKGKRLEETAIRQVGVAMVGTYKKVVTNIPRFEFIQTDAVSDRLKPRSLKISIRDGNELISDEKLLTFDSESQSLDDRKKDVRLTLKSGQTIDNNREYYLVLRNADDDTEYDRISLVIDITFANDF